MFTATFVFAQIKKYITDNTVEIKSADINDTAYNDLVPLQKAIGNKQVVMLGEVYHGDGETMKLKSRIVRFLHERMGFNVLVFESDFFALNDGYELMKAGRIPYDSLIFLSVFPIWTKCGQARDLFTYTKESTLGLHGGELIISGMDNRGVSGFSLRKLETRLDTFLHQVDIPFVRSPSYPFFISEIAEAWAEKNKIVCDSLTVLLPVVIQELITKQSQSPDSKIDFYIHVLRGLTDYYKMVLYYWINDEYKVTKKDYPMHDFGMAENLKWLVTKKFANEKIIVWAHNAHVEKRKEKLPYAKYTSMGQFFIEDSIMAKQTYIIGTTCFSGKGKLTIKDKAEKAAKPNKNSIESWIHFKHYQYGFVDFSKIVDKDNITPFYMKSYLTTTYKQNWTKVYDGILYVEKAVPCRVEDFIKK